MGKNNVKFTYEYVKNFFEERGCTLLSKEYINCHSPLQYVCKCGEITTISFTKFKSQKNGCKYCTKIGGWKHEDVAKYFAEQGCELLEQYKGVKEKVKYRCSCGKIDYITFDNFKNNNRRCRNCGTKKLSNAFKFNIEYVREYFYKNNCIPLFDEYKGVHVPLKYQCSCGNISYIAFSDFKVGKRCNNCSSKRRNETKYSKGSSPVSIQQLYLHNLVGGELNYPVGNSCLDIAFPDEKIYIEYDGSGHDLSVTLKAVSKEQFKEKQKRRSYALYKRGWKEIRIISKKDKLPVSEDKIKKMIKHAKQILKDRSWIVFDIDNLQIKYNNYVGEYNFGQLKRLRKNYAS